MVRADALEKTAFGQAATQTRACTGDSEFDVLSFELVEHLGQVPVTLCSRCHPFLTWSRTRSSGTLCAVVKARSISDRKWIVFANQSGVANNTTRTPGTSAVFVTLLNGAQLVVPGMQPRTCN